MREIDAIVAALVGPWASFEVKLGGEAGIEEAAGKLLELQDRLDTAVPGNPATLAVAVGAGP